MKKIALLLAVLFTFVTGFTALPAAAAGKTSKATSAAKMQMSTKVDINTADQTALETLPGVGPSTAAAIIAFRKANGRIKSADDLLKVKGIGPKKMEKMKPYLSGF